MIPNNIKELISALVEKTKVNQAIWGKTARENEFKLNFAKGAITTDNWTENSSNKVDFAIFNEFGDKIETFTSEKGEEEFDFLLDLHKVAKRQFYKVDDTITGLIFEIKSDKSVGKREIEDNGLPF